MNEIGFQELGSTPRDAALFSVSFKSFHESPAPSSLLAIVSNLNGDGAPAICELVGSDGCGCVVRMDIVVECVEGTATLVSTILYPLRPYRAMMFCVYWSVDCHSPY